MQRMKSSLEETLCWFPGLQKYNKDRIVSFTPATMPKKFKGENSKAVEARLRKESQKKAEQDRRQKEVEDEFWKDENKHVVRKQQRKEEKEKKKQEAMQRKQENQKLFEEELTSIKSAKPPPSSKVTQAQIQAHRERQAATAAGQAKTSDIPYDEKPLEENVNRLEVEGDEARTVEDAISVLSVNEPALDKHPEKRMKAAYQEFEDINLPRLKAENPNMRLSQLKQILKKDWMKSPSNPMNQKHMAYNTKR